MAGGGVFLDPSSPMHFSHSNYSNTHFVIGAPACASSRSRPQEFCVAHRMHFREVLHQSLPPGSMVYNPWLFPPTSMPFMLHMQLFGSSLGSGLPGDRSLSWHFAHTRLMPQPPHIRAAAAAASAQRNQSPGRLGPPPLAQLPALEHPVEDADAEEAVAPGQRRAEILPEILQLVSQVQADMMVDSNNLDLPVVPFRAMQVTMVNVNQVLVMPPLPDPYLQRLDDALRPPIPPMSPRSASKDPGMLAITEGEQGSPGEGSEACDETDGEALQHLEIAQALEHLKRHTRPATENLAQRWRSWCPHTMLLVSTQSGIPMGRASDRPCC